MKLPRQGRPFSGRTRSPAGAFRLVVTALAVAPPLTYALRRHGLERTLRRLDRLGQASWWLRDVDPAAAARAAGWAFRALPGLRGRCLERSLVQYALHRIAGDRARFVIGIRRDEQRAFGAHAWVETDETPADAAPFAPLLTRDTG
jgi:hypothetical protein